MPRLTAKQRQENEEINQEFLDYMEKLRIQKLKAKRHAAGVKGHQTRARNKLAKLGVVRPVDPDRPDSVLTLVELIAKYPKSLDTPSA